MTWQPSPQPYRFHFLLHSAHLLEEVLRERLKPVGLHPGQARVIHALHRMKECSQSRLAREFDVSAASMSTMTARLLANGHIRRRPDRQDGRNQLLSLTPSGERLMERIEEVWREMDRVVIEAIGPGRAGALFENGMHLRDALGGQAPGESMENATAPARGAVSRTRNPAP